MDKMQQITAYQPNAIESADRMREAGAGANHHAASGVFADYISRKATNTVKAQRFDLAVFADYLAAAGVPASADSLQIQPVAWQGVTWGIVEGSVKWQLAGGHAVTSINRRLSTVKAYAKLAAKAGAIDTHELALIRTVAGYGAQEGKRVNERREVTRVGAKKAEHTRLTDEQAQALKAQPDVTSGKDAPFWSTSSVFPFSFGR